MVIIISLLIILIVVRKSRQYRFGRDIDFERECGLNEKYYSKTWASKLKKGKLIDMNTFIVTGLIDYDNKSEARNLDFVAWDTAVGRH